MCGNGQSRPSALGERGDALELLHPLPKVVIGHFTDRALDRGTRQAEGIVKRVGAQVDGRFRELRASYDRVDNGYRHVPIGDGGGVRRQPNG